MVTTSATTTDTASTENSHTNYTDNTHQQQSCVHHIAGITQVRVNHITACCVSDKQAYGMSLSDTGFTTADGVASCRYAGVPHEISLSDGKETTCSEENVKKDIPTAPALDLITKKAVVSSEARTCKAKNCKNLRNKLSASAATLSNTAPSNGACCNEMKVICGETVMVQQDNSLVISDLCLDHRKSDDREQPINDVLNKRENECAGGDVSFCNSTINGRICGKMRELNCPNEKLIPGNEKQSNLCHEHVCLNNHHCLHINKISENFCKINDAVMCSTKTCGACGSAENINSCSCNGVAKCIAGINNLNSSALTSNCTVEFSTMERECGLKINEQAGSYAPLSSSASGNMSIMQGTKSVEEKYVRSVCSVRCSLPLSRVKDVLKQFVLSDSENNVCVKKEQGLNKENSECTIDTSVTSTSEMKSILVSLTKTENVSFAHDSSPDTSLTLNNLSEISSNSNPESDFSMNHTASSFANTSSNSSFSDNSNTVHLNLQTKATRRLFCLYCDRTFVNLNLRQKHIDRTHSIAQSRRSSSRTPSHNQSSPVCMYCGKLFSTTEDLNKLFEHLVTDHSAKYNGCLLCTERFTSKEILREHNEKIHGIFEKVLEATAPKEVHIQSDYVMSKTISNVDTSEKANVSVEEAKIQTNSKVINESTLDTFGTDRLKNFENRSPNDSVADFEECIQPNIISSEILIMVQRKKTDEESKSSNEKLSVKKLKCVPKTKTFSNPQKTNPRSNRRTTRSTVTNAQVNSKSKNKQLKVNLENLGEIMKLETSKEGAVKNDADVQSVVVKENDSMPIVYEFDENFFSCVSFNIRDNLMNHLDGKLFHMNDTITNDSNSSKNLSDSNSKQGQDSSFFGNNLALTAITPITTLLTSQSGIDSYQQIEYGSKAPIVRRHFVKYNFRSRKQKNTEYDIPKDVSKLDMWTQIAMKLRQQKVKNLIVGKNNERYTISDDTCRKAELQVEELNRILDMRGPFQDLREEALNSTQKLFEEKCSSVENVENSDEIKIVIEDILINVFEKSTKPVENTYTSTTSINLDKFINDRLKLNLADESKKIIHNSIEKEINPSELDVCYQIVTRSRLHNENSTSNKTNDAEESRPRHLDVPFPKDDEIPNYFKLSRNNAPSTSTEDVKLKTINETLCSLGIDSRQIENFLSDIDLNVIVTSTVELSGEWARPRIYICGACGVKVPNLKQLEDHKFFAHPYIWCMHYEFVGNQSDFYLHLNIPGLGRMLEVESNIASDFVWNRSTSRACSKCNKQCNSLGDLHRHMLECGGDWTWMLAKKKCKYRPYGSRRRRQRGMKRNLSGRLTASGDAVDDEGKRRECRRDRSKLSGPRPPRPSDAETIQRMLANLPPKRTSRKILSFKEGVTRKHKINHNLASQNTTAKSKILLGKSKPENGSQKSKYKFKSARLRKLNNKTESALSSSIKAASKKMKQTLQKNLRDRNHLQKSQNQNKTGAEKVNSSKIEPIKSTPSKVKSKTVNKTSTNSSNSDISPNPSEQIKIAAKTKSNIFSKVLSSKVIDTTTALGPKTKTLRSMNKLNITLSKVMHPKNKPKIPDDKTKADSKVKNCKSVKKIMVKHNKRSSVTLKTSEEVTVPTETPKLVVNRKDDRNINKPLKNSLLKNSKILRRTRAAKLTTTLFRKKLRSSQTEATPSQKELVLNEKDVDLGTNQKEIESEQNTQIELNKNVKSSNDIAMKTKQGIIKSGKVVKKTKSIKSLANLRKTKLNSLRKSVRTNNIKNVLTDNKKTVNDKKKFVKIPFKRAISVDGLVHFDCASNDSLNSIKVNSDENVDDVKSAEQNVKKIQAAQTKVKNFFKPFKKNLSDFVSKFQKKDVKVLSEEVTSVTEVGDETDIVDRSNKTDDTNKKEKVKRSKPIRSLSARLSKRISKKIETIMEENVNSEHVKNCQPLNVLTKSVSDTDLNKKNTAKRKTCTSGIKNMLRKEKETISIDKPEPSSENCFSLNTSETVPNEDREDIEQCDMPLLCSKQVSDDDDFKTMPTLEKVEDAIINKEPLNNDIPVLSPVINTGSNKRKPSEIKKIQNIFPEDEISFNFDIVPIRENIYPICNLNTKKTFKDHGRETGVNKPFHEENIKYPIVVEYAPNFEDEVLDLSIRKNKDVEETPMNMSIKNCNSVQFNNTSVDLSSVAVSKNEVNDIAVSKNESSVITSPQIPKHVEDRSKLKNIKKPVRRLNDCIAMLTCKLQQKLTNPTKSQTFEKSIDIPIVHEVSKYKNESANEKNNSNVNDAVNEIKAVEEIKHVEHTVIDYQDAANKKDNPECLESSELNNIRVDKCINTDTIQVSVNHIHSANVEDVICLDDNSKNVCVKIVSEENENIRPENIVVPQNESSNEENHQRPLLEKSIEISLETPEVSTLELEKTVPSSNDEKNPDIVSETILPPIEENPEQLTNNNETNEVIVIDKQSDSNNIEINKTIKKKKSKIKKKSHFKIGNVQRKKKSKRKKQRNHEITNKEQEEIISLLLDSKVNEIFMDKDDVDLDCGFIDYNDSFDTSTYLNEKLSNSNKTHTINSVNEILPVTNVDNIIKSVAENVNIRNEICDNSENSLENSLIPDEKLECIDNAFLENISIDFESFNKADLSDSSSEDVPLIKLVNVKNVNKNKRRKKETIKVKVKKFNLKAKRKMRTEIDSKLEITDQTKINSGPIEKNIDDERESNIITDTQTSNEQIVSRDEVDFSVHGNATESVLENKSMPVLKKDDDPSCLEDVSNLQSQHKIITDLKENEPVQIENDNMNVKEDINISSLEDTNISLINEDVIPTDQNSAGMSLYSENIKRFEYLENIDTIQTASKEVLDPPLRLEPESTFDPLDGVARKVQLDNVIPDDQLEDIHKIVPLKHGTPSPINNTNISVPIKVDTNTSISLDNNEYINLEKGTRHSLENSQSNLLVIGEYTRLENDIEISSKYDKLALFENNASLFFKKNVCVSLEKKTCNTSDENTSIPCKNNPPVCLEQDTCVQLKNSTNVNLERRTIRMDNCASNSLKNNPADDLDINESNIVEDSTCNILENDISIPSENISNTLKITSIPEIKNVYMPLENHTSTAPVQLENNAPIPLEYLNTSISLEDITTSLPLDHMKVSVILEDINKSIPLDAIIATTSDRTNIMNTSAAVCSNSSRDVNITTAGSDNCLISTSHRLIDSFESQQNVDVLIPVAEENVRCVQEQNIENKREIEMNLTFQKNTQASVSEKYDICTFNRTDDLIDVNKVNFQKNELCSQEDSVIICDSNLENVEHNIMDASTSRDGNLATQKPEYSHGHIVDSCVTEKHQVEHINEGSTLDDVDDIEANACVDNNRSPVFESIAHSKTLVTISEDTFQNNIFSNIPSITQSSSDAESKLNAIEDDFHSSSQLMFQTNSVVENEGNSETFNSDILNQNSSKNNKIVDEKSPEYNLNHVTKVDYDQSETVDSGKENNNVTLPKLLTKYKAKRNKNKRKPKSSETLQSVLDHATITNDKISFNNNYNSGNHNNDMLENLNSEVENSINDEMIDHSENKVSSIVVPNDLTENIVSICSKTYDNYKSISSPLSTDSEDELPLSKLLSSQTNTIDAELDSIENTVEDIVDINLPKFIEELTPILEGKELNILENIENIDKNELLDEGKEMNLSSIDDNSESDATLPQKEMIESLVSDEILNTITENHINEIFSNENDTCNALHCNDNVSKNKIETCLEQPETNEKSLNVYEFPLEHSNFTKKNHRKKKGKISKAKKHSSKSKHNSDIRKIIPTYTNEKVEPIILHLSRKTSNSSNNNENSDFVITEIKGNKDILYSNPHKRSSIDLDVIEENVSISSTENAKSSNASFSIDNDIDNGNSEDFPEQNNSFEDLDKEQALITTDRHSPVLLKIKTNKMKKLTRKMKKSRKTVTKLKELAQPKKRAVVDHFCDICNKHFCRADNLAKHKMTFTHIAKLSEIEAKQDELRRKEQKEIELNAAKQSSDFIDETISKFENAYESSAKSPIENVNSTNENSSFENASSDDISTKNDPVVLLQEDNENKNSNTDTTVEEQLHQNCNTITLNSDDDDDDDEDNDDDICNESYQLGPDVNYPDLVISNQPKRYRSLGERKSFDLNPITSPPKSFEEINSEILTKIPETHINSTSENHANGPSKDDIMIDVNEKLTNDSSITCKKYISSHITKVAEKNKDSTPLINEISDNSNRKHYKNIGNFNTNRFDENYSGKKLNRDEELFLECCSLLKSSSESHKLNKKVISDHSNFKSKTLSGESIDNKAVQPAEENVHNLRSENWSSSDSVASDWISNRDSASNTPFGAVLINNTSYKWLEQEKQIRSKSNSLTDVRYEDVSSNSNSILINQDNLDIQYEDISVSSMESNPCQHYENANDQEQLSENEDQTSNELVNNVDTKSYKEEQSKNCFNNFVGAIDDADLLIADKINLNKIEDKLYEEKSKNEFQTKQEQAENIIQAIDIGQSNIKQSSISADLQGISSPNDEIPVTEDDKDTIDSITEANKKILTKGAKKVFEGIKVSIPTHELNLSEVLNCSVRTKNSNDTYDKLCEDQNLSSTSSKTNVSFGLKLYKNGVEVSQSVLKSFKSKLTKTPSESNFADMYTVSNGSKKKNSGFFNRVGNKLGFREVKRRKSQKSKSMRSRFTKMKSGAKKQETPKVKDIYDFEDTQDNDGLGLFNSENKLPLFKSFRSQKTANPSIEALSNDVNTDNNLSEQTNVNRNNHLDSDSEPYPYIDSLSVDNSPSSEEDVPAVKSRSVQKRRIKSRKKNIKNDNQKKCMIMGRIFKHVVKSKSSEPNEIVDSESSKLLEGNMKKGGVKVDTAVNIKLSEKEIDSIFDALLGRDSSAIEKEITKLKKIDECSAPSHLERLDTLENKNNADIDSTYTLKTEVVVSSPQVVQKPKKYNKKARTRTDSSSDDEFCLSAKKPASKTNRKRTFKKQKVQQTLNLEQEIRECIGVAGRKSQRKCTSGKQNVLVEFWSSDELSDAEVERKKLPELIVTNTDDDKPKDIDFTTTNPYLAFQNDVEELKESTDIASQTNGDVLIKSDVSNTLIVPLEKSMNKKETLSSSAQKVVFKTKSSRLHSAKRKIFQRKRPLKRVKRSEKSNRIHRKSNAAKRRKVCSAEIKERPVTTVMKSENKDQLSQVETTESLAATRRKRSASEKLYYWSSSSDDEFEDLIEVKPIREDPDDDRPIQHGWIVGDSPKKLVTLLAHAKGKKIDAECVKEQGKRNKVSA